MDPLTQGVVGAMLAQCVARRDERRVATLVGALAGMSADLDVLIHSAEDPLLQVEFHRHFTHSLAFIPFGSTIVALLLFAFLRRRWRWRAVWRWATAGYATAGLLDACTSYGTHLLWPFTSTRTAWNLISIVDPAFTGLLSILVLLGVWKGARGSARLPHAALGAAVLYLACGLAQRERASAALEQRARERGHEPSAVTVKPTIGNLLLWRGVYRAGDQWHVDAVRVALGAARIYEGSSVEAVGASGIDELPADSIAAEDVERFRRFSDGCIARAPGRPNTITDLRYSPLPHGLDPLWAIEYDPARPDQHVAFRTFRGLDAEDRGLFLALLRGTAD